MAAISAAWRANDDVWCVGGKQDTLGGLCKPVGGGGVVLIYSTSTHSRSGCTLILVETPCLNGGCGGYIGGMEGQ